MKNERILSHTLSHKLTAEEISAVSAAGTTGPSNTTTYPPQGPTDSQPDVGVDL